jgi:hypothetical protein
MGEVARGGRSQRGFQAAQDLVLVARARSGPVRRLDLAGRGRLAHLPPAPCLARSAPLPTRRQRTAWRFPAGLRRKRYRARGRAVAPPFSCRHRRDASTGVGAPGLLPDGCAVREDRRRAAGANRAPAAGTPLLLAASAHDDLAEQAVILVADAGGEQQ